MQKREGKEIKGSRNHIKNEEKGKEEQEGKRRIKRINFNNYL